MGFYNDRQTPISDHERAALATSVSPRAARDAARASGTVRHRGRARLVWLSPILVALGGVHAAAVLVPIVAGGRSGFRGADVLAAAIAASLVVAGIAIHRRWRWSVVVAGLVALDTLILVAVFTSAPVDDYTAVLRLATIGAVAFATHAVHDVTARFWHGDQDAAG